MLTPDVLESKVFQASGRGAYRAEDVDAFFAEVSASYAQMFKENGELIKKISLLAGKVEKYKEEEDSLKRALISAQALADKIVKDAEESVAGSKEQAETEAKAILDKANAEAKEAVLAAEAQAKEILAKSEAKADDLLGTANRTMTQKGLELDMLKKEAAEFKASLLNLYKDHLSLINSIPDYVEEQMAEETTEAAEEVAEPVAAEEPVAKTAEEAPMEIPVEETPTAETPTAETPAAETPTAETPAAETPAAETPAAEIPVETPVEEAPVEETPQMVFEDISSGKEEEEIEGAEEPTQKAEEGFTFDFSAFEDEEEETKKAPGKADEGFTFDVAAMEDENTKKAEEKLSDKNFQLDFSNQTEEKPAHPYAVIEEEAEDEDEDKSPNSFHSFFKKNK